MASPQVIIIRVPDQGSIVNANMSSTSQSESEMKLLRLPVTPAKSLSTESSKNRPNMNEIVTQLNTGSQRLRTTVEDKFLRKKLKNRIAAQNSRDKKKARMEELERLVKKLSEENESVTQECHRLKAEVASLTEENTQLKQKLSCYCGEAYASWPVEPAEGTGPLTVNIPISDESHRKDEAADAYLLQIEELAERIIREGSGCPESNQQDLCKSGSSTFLDSVEVVGAKAENLESNELLTNGSMTVPKTCPILDHGLHEVTSQISPESETTNSHTELGDETSDGSILMTDVNSDLLMECSDSVIFPKSEISDIIVDSIDIASLSDNGYESLDSPASELSSSDQSTWDESFSILFPTLM